MLHNKDKEHEMKELYPETDNPYHITDPPINACSAMDCTGAVPAAPASEDELEAYLDVYQFEPKSCRLEGGFTGAANSASDAIKEEFRARKKDVEAKWNEEEE